MAKNTLQTFDDNGPCVHTLRAEKDTLKCQNDIFRLQVRQMNQEIGAMKATIQSLETRIKTEQELRELRG